MSGSPSAASSVHIEIDGQQVGAGVLWPAGRAAWHSISADRRRESRALRGRARRRAQVDEIISVGEFYEQAGGGQIIFT